MEEVRRNKEFHKKVFSIVIPSKSQDVFFLKNLLHSLRMFLEISSVLFIHVIVPDKDLNEISNLLVLEVGFFQNKLKLIK